LIDFVIILLFSAKMMAKSIFPLRSDSKCGGASRRDAGQTCDAGGVIRANLKGTLSDDILF